MVKQLLQAVSNTSREYWAPPSAVWRTTPIGGRWHHPQGGILDHRTGQWGGQGMGPTGQKDYQQWESVSCTVSSWKGAKSRSLITARTYYAYIEHTSWHKVLAMVHNSCYVLNFSDNEFVSILVHKISRVLFNMPSRKSQIGGDRWSEAREMLYLLQFQWQMPGVMSWRRRPIWPLVGQWVSLHLPEVVSCPGVGSGCSNKKEGSFIISVMTRWACID